MFMISKFMFDAAYKAQGHLVIDPYETRNHINNFYYFRLGGIKQNGKTIPIKNPISLRANSFNHIWSLESFQFNDRVFAFFGNVSSLVKIGVDLVHSPTIDPGFSGSLELGLRNNTDSEVVLDPYETIGKIIFFDCADTFLNVAEFVENALKESELSARKKAAELMLSAYSKLSDNS